MANKKLVMKLLIDSKAQKVLFAEAGKDVVDFLFSLLGMSVGSMVKLLTKNRRVGCVGNLYHSLESLDETALLNPVVSSPSFSQNTLLLTGSTSVKTYYKCSYNSRCSKYVTDGCGTSCPSCRNQMTSEVTYVEPNNGKGKANAQGGGGGGLVKGVVTYTIMDDLTVTPMSTISSITLINKFHVKDMSALQEKTVRLGFEEGLELLRVSLQSRIVLTKVFLR